MSLASTGTGNLPAGDADSGHCSADPAARHPAAAGLPAAAGGGVGRVAGRRDRAEKCPATSVPARPGASSYIQRASPPRRDQPASIRVGGLGPVAHNVRQRRLDDRARRVGSSRPPGPGTSAEAVRHGGDLVVLANLDNVDAAIGPPLGARVAVLRGSVVWRAAVADVFSVRLSAAPAGRVVSGGWEGRKRRPPAGTAPIRGRSY